MYRDRKTLRFTLIKTSFRSSSPLAYYSTGLSSSPSAK